MSRADTPYSRAYPCVHVRLSAKAPLAPLSFLPSQEVTAQLETPGLPLPAGQAFFLTLAPDLGR